MAEYKSFKISNDAFNRVHAAFIQYVSEKDQVPFTEFDRSKFLHETELDYKIEAFEHGRSALNLEQWSSWRKEPGKILEAVRNACNPSISKNLLEHRYGPEHGSYKALYLVSTQDEICGLEAQLYNFFLNGDTTYERFGPRFEEFLKYLQENRLGASWLFLTYLAYLLDCDLYFEVLPTRFEIAINYLGNARKIQGSISWSLYKLILDFVGQLKVLLALHSPDRLIDIHTYVFLLGDAIIPRLEKGNAVAEPIDELALLEKRQRAAKNREKIGLLGELAVLEYERIRLKRAGREDLASHVQHVADMQGSQCDILSFTEAGEPLSIEVKSTTRDVEMGDSFFLSEEERKYAESCGQSWCLCRVVFSGTTRQPPEITPLGNMIANSEWKMLPASWLVTKKSNNM